jgi:hypothetical protein
MRRSPRCGPPRSTGWRARTSVEFANQDDRYREAADYLRSREVMRHLP